MERGELRNPTTPLPSQHLDEAVHYMLKKDWVQLAETNDLRTKGDWKGAKTELKPLSKRPIGGALQEGGSALKMYYSVDMIFDRLRK